ncbi:MAG: class I SAM-dependent methyltransferase [Desulfobacteraceae bacterium]|nr:MAG: class I SAM-dependent methyltransferase [Desulfobacteraceae bacterium]
MGKLSPAQLLVDHRDLFRNCTGAVLDLACGEGHNGILLALQGCDVVLADRSEEALQKARTLAAELKASVTYWQVDLEQEEENPLQGKSYGGILVFRYLHRPLIPSVREALAPGGVLLYETYTLEQARFGKPRNPDFLLKPGELERLFGDWDVIHYHEGIYKNPDRAVAGIVCKKPF